MSKPSPGPWDTMAGMPANLLDATGRRIAWFNGDDYHSDSTAEDEANVALVLELRDTLHAAYQHFMVNDPARATLDELCEIERRMRELLEKAGVAE